MSALAWDNRLFDGAMIDLLGTTKREFPVVWREQVKGIVRRVVQLTPPDKKGQGVAAVKRDFKRLFKGVRQPKKGITYQSPASVHAQYKSQLSGRSRVRSNKHVRVLSAELGPYRAEILRHVGWLKSGWRTAAAALGIKMPAFANLPAPGDVRIDLDGEILVIEWANQVKYAGRAYDLQRRMQTAMDSQAAAILRRVDSYYDAIAKKASAR